MASPTLHSVPTSRSTYFQLYPDRLPASKDVESTRLTTSSSSAQISQPQIALAVPSTRAKGQERIVDKGKSQEHSGKQPVRDRSARAREGSASSLLSVAAGKERAYGQDLSWDGHDLRAQIVGNEAGGDSKRSSATLNYLDKALESLAATQIPSTSSALTQQPTQTSTFRSLPRPRINSSTKRLPRSSSSNLASPHPPHNTPPTTLPSPLERHGSEENPPRNISLDAGVLPIFTRARPRSASSRANSDPVSPNHPSRLEGPFSVNLSVRPRKNATTTRLSPPTSFTSNFIETPGSIPRQYSDPLEDLFAGPTTAKLKFDFETGSYVAEDGSAALSVNEMEDFVDQLNGIGSKSRSSSKSRARKDSRDAELRHRQRLLEEDVVRAQGEERRAARTRESTASSTASYASSASFASMSAVQSPAEKALPFVPFGREHATRPGLGADWPHPHLGADNFSFGETSMSPSFDDMLRSYKPDAVPTASALQSSHSAPPTTRYVALPPGKPALSLTTSSSSNNSDRIKSIDDIIREHAGPKFVPPNRLDPPTPAQLLAAAARTRESSRESEESRGSVDSIEEEIRASMKVPDMESRSLIRSRSFPARIPESSPTDVPPLPRSSDQFETSSVGSTGSNYSNHQTPRQGSPAPESDAVLVERELATLLKSPRLTRLLALHRTPNQDITVSLADVGSPTGHPVIVFLGLGCVRYLIALYDEMAEALGLRLICVDRWGLGRTSAVDDSKRGFMEWSSIVGEGKLALLQILLSLSAHPSDPGCLFTVADQLGLRQFSILAHSAGGPYALAASLRSPDRVRGSIHLLAPWVSTTSDSLAGAYKYLKYVPTGVLRTAQAAEFKMQAWRLGKPPTIIHNGIGYDHRAGISSKDMSPSSPLLVLPGEFIDEEYDRSGNLVRSISGSLSDRDSTSPTTLYPSGRVAVDGRPLKGKGSKTFLGGLFGSGGDRLSKGSTSPDNASIRSFASQRPPVSTRRSFTPPSTLRPAMGSPGRHSSTMTTSISDTSLRSPTSQNSSSTATSPTSGPFCLSGLELVNGLLRASHAESLKGSTSDLMVLLERTSKPWGFRYSDVGTAVKVWHGDKDDRISLSSVKWLETEMVDCKVKIVEGADHSMMTTLKMAPKNVITLSDSDSDVSMATVTKPKPAAKKSSSKASGSAQKRKAQSSSEASSEEDVKPKKVVKPKKAVQKVALKKGKAGDSDEDDDDAGGKGKGKAKAKAKAKAPPAKKVKKEDGEGGGGGGEKKVPVWIAKKSAGPSNPGSKDIPEGQDNCLAGLTFVFTGELESLSREAGQELAKRYGGRVTTAPSSKTSYVVLGAEAGPKKLEMIKKHNIKTLTEDAFLELIGKRPSGKDDPKFIEAQKKEQAKIKEDAKSLAPKKAGVDTTKQLWTVKYAPTKVTDICGNKGSVEKLSKWLEAWPKSLKSDFKKPGPDAMGAFRCVLISGPPGIGKTTAAHLVASLLGYNVLELNASDTRSKKLLETAFKSTIENTTLAGFMKTEESVLGDMANPSINERSVIIMDEVDGMSAGDRGGVGALNALIKKTKVPIIAICNDKGTPKMKPLAATCYQMPFKRPSAMEIRSRMMSIAFKEGIKVDGKVMDQLVAGSHSDIRQIVNMLSTWRLGARAMDFDEGKKMAKMNEKNSIQTPWTLYSSLTGPQAFSPVSGLSFDDKLGLYYQDFQMLPLFVQDNYLKGKFSKSSNLQGPDKTLKDLELMTKAAEAMSDGDLVDAMIHGGQQQWSLMPVHGVFSCVRPAFHCYGQGGGYPTFPTWFGKNSTQGKLQRLLGEIQIRMRLRVSGDRKEIRQNYIPALFTKLITPLHERGAEGIEDVISLMDNYFITKEDWDAIVELGVGDGFRDDEVLKMIPSAVKSTFTRTYNKGEHPAPFHKHDSSRIPKKLPAASAPDNEEVMLEDVESEEDDDFGSSGEDDADHGVSKDKAIKMVGKKPKKAVSTKAKK
ncbi:replication factor C subunit 1, partial [Phenoliferia sp. Uapishka_3]